MKEGKIFTSLVVPVTTNGASLTALQWSEDGQAFVVTRSAVYILTPSTGITFDPPSLVEASVTKKGVRGEALSWYRNMIELEKSPTHYWAHESDDWGTVSLGSLDTSWSSVALSPSNISKESCCMMAALNTNLEVSLWAPLKNHLNGEWIKIQDVTQTIKDKETTSSSVVQKTLHSQVQSIAWSRQIDIGDGMAFADGSLLALGNRAGEVIFMHVSHDSTDDRRELRQVASIEIADDWITQLAWSSWDETDPGCFQAALACGVADGGVAIVLVHRNLGVDAQGSDFRQFDIKLKNDITSRIPSTGSTLTALKWIESRDHAPILVYINPGIVHLQKMPSSLPLGWEGTSTLALHRQPVSSSSTPFVAVSGISYYSQHDALLISLFDGSFYMIHDVTMAPSLARSDNEPRSEELTSQVRRVFATVEGNVTPLDANHTTGVLDYDGAGTVAWLHEKNRPSDFSYKHDARHSTMFIVAQLWCNENQIFEQLFSELFDIKNLNASPNHILRGIFLHLREKSFLEAHSSRIFHLLAQCNPLKDDSGSEPSGHGFGSGFRQAVATTLFQRRDIRAMRLKLGVALFCSAQGITSHPFQDMVEETSTAISWLYLKAVLRHLQTFSAQLKDGDRRMVHRWVIQSLAQKAPHTRQEAAYLANRVGVNIESPLSSDIQEQCPACHVAVPLEFGDTATCPMGHIWTRCSVTSFILATPFVRTCIGCHRKALLPRSHTPSHELDSVTWPAENSFVESLLEAARWCIFCGNRFVQVV